MTDRLYNKDAYIQQFDAVVLTMLRSTDGWEITLDRTAFYPEGGGQPCDLGTIDGKSVTAVREVNGEVIHVLQSPPTTKQVVCQIDWTRRFDYMQQHSGQHILSAILNEQLGAATVGFHLGEQSTQIDIAMAELNHEQIYAAESAANFAIFSNLPVNSQWVTQDELNCFPLRKLPVKDFSLLRLISIGSLDCCPCCGTHVSFTGEIGMIKILGWEKKNHALRIDFVCGKRALADYQTKHRVIAEVSSHLSAPVNGLADAVTQRLNKVESLSKELTTLRSQLGRAQADLLLHSTSPHQGLRVISHILHDSQPNDAAQLAKHLTSGIPVAALIAAVNQDGTKAHLVFATNIDGLDMGKLLKSVLSQLNGKGGGNARLAQGGTNYPDKLAAIMAGASEEINKTWLTPRQ